MRYVLTKSWRIWMLALIIIMIFGFGSTAVFARGGGHLRPRTWRWPLWCAWWSPR